MYPSWGNFGGAQQQNHGGPRMQFGGGPAGQPAVFGTFDTSSNSSLFSSLQEQHLQQMQQLQMLHQKQLQSVLHHGNQANAFTAAHSGGYPGTTWRPEGPGHTLLQHTQPPPPLNQPGESPPVPQPPDPVSVKPPESSGAPAAEVPQKSEEDKSSLPGQQQLWYKQHLQNLQKLKQEKAQENQKEGLSLVLPPNTEQAIPPPPSSETPKGKPPPPPPKEEPPAPPPPPEEVKEVPQNPEEAARLQQLQAAAAQWQQVQQQRAGLQYQVLMQQHEKLQQILEKYHQLIQQPANLQSMSAEMQLRHYEMQRQQFIPLFQDWHHSFVLWHQHFQSYHHKDQLQDYELQWKQWQEQMNSTNAHLQERVATLTAMVPFAANQYKTGGLGQFGQHPVQDMQIQQQPVKPGLQQPPVTLGPRPEGPRPDGFGLHSESPAGPPVRGVGPAGTVGPPVGGMGAPATVGPPLRGVCPTGTGRPPVPPTTHPPRFNNIRGQWGNNSRFDPPQQRFDVPPRFNQPPQRFERPVRFDQPRQHFDGPPRFDQTQQRFEGPPRFDKPQFGQQSQFEHRLRHPSPTVPEQVRHGAQLEAKPETKQPASIDSEISDTKTRAKPAEPPQPEKEKSDSKPDKKGNAEDMTDDNLLGNEGFFVANAPIPQTLKTDKKPKESGDKNASNNDKNKAVNSKSSVNTTCTVQSSNTAVQDLPKADGPLKNDEPLISPHLGSQKEIQSSGQIQSRPEPSKPGRERGQPTFPVQFHGRGRGQRVCGEFTGPNTVSLEENMGETSYDYRPSEEHLDMPEEQYHWQDPSYEEFGDDESAMPPEDMWMPEEHYFQTEEEYYEEPMGGPPMGRGGPSFMRGGPPRGHSLRGRGGPPMGRGGPPMGRGGPPMGRDGPPMGRDGPPMGRGGPPMGRGGMSRGGPPMGRGGPPFGRGGQPMGRGGPPMGRGGPGMGRGGPPSMGRGGPSMGRGGPPSMGRGGPPPMGRGGPPPVGREGPESEYSEEVDPYWGERRPPMRGMRPPFPPGRGRPPRDHPDYMHQIRGLPPDAARWPPDHEPLGHNLDSDDTKMDPAHHPMYHGHDPRGYQMDRDAGRGKLRMPRPAHDMMDVVDEPYNEGMERDLDWQTPPGRGPPLPPHEMIDARGMRRRPSGRMMGRGMMRPGPTHAEYEEEFNEGYVKDYGHRKEGHCWQPPQDYPPDDLNEAKYHISERDREHASLERNCPARMPPAEPYREGSWLDERDRGHPYPYDEHNRGRGELRIRDYRNEPGYQPSPSEWERSPRLPALPERRYPDDFENRRAQYEEHREDLHLDRLPNLPPAAPGPNLPESAVDNAPEGTSSTNVLALSQHQHEIILKAAQELKLIREMKEGKTNDNEPNPSATNILPELPAGLLGLEIPPDVRNVLKGMTAAAQTSVTEAMSLDARSAATGYQSALSAAPTPTVIPKTVDYGHGHEPGATVERISYGERIVLRPDPMHSNRGYEKEPLGSRDPYRRDPYFERRSDPFLDRREYSRERESYREMLPSEYERERFERERFPPRERDGRSPLEPPLHPGYRDRERNPRDKERNGSRDRDEHYGRPGSDRPPYERGGLERSGPERYSHSSSPYLDKRSYPEERGPPTVPPLPPAPQPPPRVEKKPEIKNIDDILKPPGRLSRPERIVVIMRGIPGSGKSHVAKLIRDKEVDCGGAPPRVLVLDDYFMTEVEKIRKDPDTGRGVKTKVLEYEYEPGMEDTYRSSMLKTFKKTLDDGFFPFIILDTINDRVKHFDQFWSAAKTKGFEVYVAEITADTQTCAKRNVHGRTLKDIMKMSNNWEPLPRHMVRLDVRSLLQDAAIEEVEMEDFNPDDEPKEPKGEEEEESDLGYIPKSKWEMDTSEAKLDKLDGLGSSGKRKREDMAGLDDFLQLPDDYATRMSEPGKKRVRWADLEEQKEADRKRAIGFVMGQTDWERITDESGQLAQRALNRTKYF
ncbi:YLP motif-containing protein 1 isoform X2 [Antennarius striatus]|uniref:YLP motif-containing protein 1 isoform X2 n=1 Tax=Antennarius striatus TaxID=241820 RepID=UPI0035B0ED82